MGTDCAFKQSHRVNIHCLRTRLQHQAQNTARLLPAAQSLHICHWEAHALCMYCRLTAYYTPLPVVLCREQHVQYCSRHSTRTKPALLFSGSPWDTNIFEFFATTMMPMFQTAVMTGLLDPSANTSGNMLLACFHVVDLEIDATQYQTDLLQPWLSAFASVAWHALTDVTRNPPISFNLWPDV